MVGLGMVAGEKMKSYGGENEKGRKITSKTGFWVINSNKFRGVGGLECTIYIPDLFSTFFRAQTVVKKYLNLDKRY